MDKADLKKLERVRQLRRDKQAARLAEIRRAFEPVDQNLKSAEDRMSRHADTISAAGQQLATLRSGTIGTVLDGMAVLADMERQRENLQNEVDHHHEERIRLLSAIRTTRDEWRMRQRDCDRWDELQTMTLEAEALGERIAEENTSNEAIFYIRSNK